MMDKRSKKRQYMVLKSPNERKYTIRRENIKAFDKARNATISLEI